MLINPEIYGIAPSRDVTVEFNDMLLALRENVAKKKLVLLKGVYYFSSKNAVSRKLYITNTIGEDEYRASEEKNVHKVAINIENLKDLEIDGSGSTFLLDGRFTNIVIDNCENIKLKNINIETHKPNVHKFTVLKASPFYATFKLDEQSDYMEQRGKYYFYGTDYKTDFVKHRMGGYWTPTACPDNFNHLVRHGAHPFKNSVSIKEIAPRVFKVRYISPAKLCEGQVFYVYSTRRTNVGIFAQNTKKIMLQNVSQRHNRSLAFVAQNCTDIQLDKIDFSPGKTREVDFTSMADFAQISMCRGEVKITNSNFDAAGDDTVNVHGFNFKIVEISGAVLKVKFCHPQSYGFPCFFEGDTIAFINSASLIEKGTATVLSVEMIDLYTFELTLDTEEIPVKTGACVENISACPDFEFSGNTVNRIVTRGLLVTTRGKVLIEGNKFLNTGENGILIANDAASWYESGPVKDVTIRGNAFMNCDGNVIYICPQNKRNEGPVHENILIENNLFYLGKSRAYNIKSTKNVVIKNNVYMELPEKDDWAKFENVEELSFEDKPSME